MVKHRGANAWGSQVCHTDSADGVFIGPYDLSGSYGVPGQTGHERVRAGCRRVLDAGKAAGKAAGLHMVLPTAEAMACCAIRWG